VGRGGQAEVWLARDTELDVLVAIKVFRADLTPTQRERLRREVMLGRTLQHPGLVRIFELIDGGDRLAVAMEWVPEGSLAQRLESGRLPVDEVVRVAEQVLEVLAYLHGQNVVHRDIKPSNLLVDSENRIRLADLGLARPLDDDRGLTRTLASVGTPAYMSPEQIRGAEPAPAADLYGLGVTLYQLVTGELPFSGTSEYDVANKHLTEPVVDPRRLRPGCPAWLAGFILRLLEKSPRDRFRSAEEAAAALQRRRVLVSPRTWRRAAAAAGVVAAAAVVATVSLRIASRREFASVTITGSTVAARDSGGRTLWEKSYPGLEPRAVVGDFLGDGSPEVAVGVVATLGLPSATQALFVLDSDGNQQAAIATGEQLLAPPNDVFSDLIDGVQPFPADLDGDGRPELGWITKHRLWYPTVVGAWNPRAGVKPSPLLTNSGHLHTVRAVDVDGDGVNELVTVGQNNPLGWQLVVAVIEPRRTPDGTYAAGSSPDLLAGWNSTVFNSGSVASYTLLGPRGGSDDLVDAGSAGITVRVAGREVRLDPDGNPAGSPLAGRGRAPRRQLWDDLVVLSKELEAGRPSERIAAFRERNALALVEPPTRLAADLMLARSLAVADDHAGSIALLRAGLVNLPDDLDLRLRLGEQLAISGRRQEAMEELASATRVQTIGRNPYDAEVAWVTVASLEGDAQEFDKALAFVSAANTNGAHDIGRSACFGSLWAFVRGDWRDVALRQGAPCPGEPYITVLRTWAELERGGDPAVVARAAEELAANAEMRDVASILRARALVRGGRAAEAREIAAATTAALTRTSRTNVLALVWLSLGHRVLGEAAEALDDRPGAVEHYRRAAAIAPRCWFGTPPPRP